MLALALPCLALPCLALPKLKLQAFFADFSDFFTACNTSSLQKGA